MITEQNKLTLDIKGTFEVAIARNRVRQGAAALKLPLMLQARASAAITTIVELVLFQSKVSKRELKLVVLFHTEQAQQGIEFQFFAPFRSDILKHITVAEWQLQQACDELEISQHGSFDHVTMRIWSRRQNS
jgi:hypothetical protein